MARVMMASGRFRGPATPTEGDSRGAQAQPRTAERCFTGKLGELPLPAILQFLAVNQKTGKLTLTRREAHGVVVLRGGRIIFAGSSSIRETFGAILVCRGLVTEAVLTEALERQHWSGEERRLGRILVEMGAIAPQSVEDVVRHQVGRVLAELCQWSDGFFRFDVTTVPVGDEIELDARDFVSGEGLSADHVLLEVATRLDEESPQTPAEETSSPPDTSTLSGIADDLATPALPGELTLMLMRFAARAVDRGVLLALRGDNAEPVGYFGIVGTPANRRTPGLGAVQVPLGEAPLLTSVLRSRHAHRGRPEEGPGNRRLFSLLGGSAPPEVVVIPVVVGARVVLLFYGDNLPSGRPIGPMRPLELVFAEAGLKMEKAVLEARIHALERAKRAGS